MSSRRLLHRPSYVDGVVCGTSHGKNGKLTSQYRVVTPLLCLSLTAVLLASLPGCGNSWNGAEEELFDEDLFQLGASTDSSPETQEGQAENADVNLTLGSHFPLLKSVEQTLSQSSPEGLTTSRSNLDLVLTLSVEELRDGKTRLGAHYDRVRFRQDVAGRSVEYDSGNPTYPVPAEAQPYQGLVNNVGFSFWLGADNQIVELIGFEAFLDACLRDVPYEVRAGILAGFAEMPPQQRIADFLDEGIGLLRLPSEGTRPNAPVRPGDSWNTKKLVLQPLPMFVSTQYTLVDINDRETTIDIRGTIASAARNTIEAAGAERVHVSVLGGQSQGSCTIDRRTGLPVRSRVERYIDMQVQAAGSVDFRQRQHMVTTVRSLAEAQSAYSVPASTATSASARSMDEREARQPARRSDSYGSPR